MKISNYQSAIYSWKKSNLIGKDFFKNITSQYEKEKKVPKFKIPSISSSLVTFFFLSLWYRHNNSSNAAASHYHRVHKKKAKKKKKIEELRSKQNTSPMTSSNALLKKKSLFSSLFLAVGEKKIQIIVKCRESRVHYSQTQISNWSFSTLRNFFFGMALSGENFLISFCCCCLINLLTHRDRIFKIFSFMKKKKMLWEKNNSRSRFFQIFFYGENKSKVQTNNFFLLFLIFFRV